MTDEKDTGGPAFPQYVQSDLCTLQENGTVKFEYELKGGMTLRDYFAGQALAGMLAGWCSDPSLAFNQLSEVPDDAYNIADAMLAERNKRGG